MEAASPEASAPWQPQDDPSEQDTFAERPELFVGAAFAGGLAIAGLIRWLGRDE